jgi:hypothetical protein
LLDFGVNYNSLITLENSCLQNEKLIAFCRFWRFVLISIFISEMAKLPRS